MFRSPDPGRRRYVDTRLLRRGERLEIAALPGADVDVADLLTAR